MKIRIFIVLVLFMKISPALGNEAVTWMMQEFPPNYILSGEMKGEGFGDRFVGFLENHLTDYDHNISYAPMSRILFQMKTQDGVCTAMARRTPEREAYLAFSARPQWNTPNRAIVRKDRLAKFAPYRDGEGALDLQALAGDANFTVAHNSSISYGNVIDSFLNNKTRVAKDIPFVHMSFPLEMLEDERIDIIFGLDSALNYYKKLYKIKFEFTAIPLKGEESHFYTYVSCSKKPLGLRVIADVDKLLENNDNYHDFLSPLKSWYSPDDFSKAMQETLSEGASKK